MADQQLQIDVKTTADLSGLQAVGAEVSKINTDIASQLAASGAAFDPVSQSFKSITVDAKATADAALLTGANLGKARGEATVLARELATGNVQARTMGALLGALGTPLTIAAIAGIGLYKIIDQIADAIMKDVKQAAEFETALNKTVRQWAEMARYAHTLSDEIHLADKITEQLEKMKSDMEKFRSDELPPWRRFWDDLRAMADKSWWTGSGEDPAAADKAAQLARKQAEMTDFVRAGNTELNVEQENTEKWAEAIAHLDQSIKDYGQDAKEAAFQLEHLNRMAAEDPTNPSILEARKQALKDFQYKSKQYQDLIKYQTQLNAEAKKEDHRDVLATLREEETILQGIRQQQTLIGQNPLLGVDQKDALLLQSYSTEVQQLIAEIAKLQALKAGPLDPVQLQQVNQKLQGANFELQLLQLKMVGLAHPFSAELINWANSFGTAAHQAAGALTNTLGTSINGISQGLAGLIFQTGNWRQTMAQTAESIVADLIRIALQFLVSRTLMFVINKAFSSQESGVANAQASGAYAAWEPAAIAASTASYGVAAGVGLAAFLAAVASGAAAGVASSAIGGAGGAVTLHGGGRVRRMHSGGLAPDEQLIIAQQEEFMVQRDVVRQPGVLEFLTALNEGMLFHAGGLIPRFHGGGDVYDDWGHIIEGAEPSWVTSSRGQGPIGDTWSGDPSIEPTPIPTPSNFPHPAFDFPGGPQVITPTDRSDFGSSDYGPVNYNPSDLVTSAAAGNPWDPTAIYGAGWNPQGYPLAVAVQALNPTDPTGLLHIGQHVAPKHSGGPIGRFNFGRAITRSPRFHSGGSLGGAVSAGAGRPQIHVNNYTDLKILSKEMASQRGQKIIIDTVRGRRIDLGI